MSPEFISSLLQDTFDKPLYFILCLAGIFCLFMVGRQYRFVAILLIFFFALSLIVICTLTFEFHVFELTQSATLISLTIIGLVFSIWEVFKQNTRIIILLALILLIIGLTNWRLSLPTSGNTTNNITQKNTVKRVTMHQAKETLVVPFKNGWNGVITQNTYKGTVIVKVSGTGQADHTQMSDAFYTYTDRYNNPVSPWRDNSIGGTLFINHQTVDTFIVGEIPAYKVDHNYYFKMKVPNGHINFDIADDYPDDNTGFYIITITPA